MAERRRKTASDDDGTTPKDTRTPAQKQQDEDDLKAALDEWKLSEEFFRDQRSKEAEDLKFEAGQHWSTAELDWKRDKREPAFVIDQLSSPINKTANQPVPRAVVSAVGEGADPTSAEYWQGLVRRVENLSGHEAILKWARLHAIKMGRGFWRIRADYFSQVDKKPSYTISMFDQDVRIEPILFQHSVYEDPRCRQLDFSDARFGIITEDIEWSEFGRRWPNATKTTQDVFPRQEGAMVNWTTTKTVRVAERYYIVDEPLTLCLLKRAGLNGVEAQVVEKKAGQTYEGWQVHEEHTFQIPRVKWMRFTAAEVLERRDVPGRYIPIVKIVGERRIVDGKEDDRGMVRMAKGPQRLVNFMESRLAKAVDEDSFSTVMAEADTVAEFEDEWHDMHINRPALVRYRGKSDVDGKPLDKPQILQSQPSVQAIALAATRASMGLRSVLGVPDVTPDELRPEQSGKAIKARQAEQAQTTSHYGDSMDGGVRLSALIIMSMGREVWTMPRIMRIIGKDEQPTEVVTYSGAGQLPAAQQKATQGLDQAKGKVDPRHLLDLEITDYDVSVTAGKGYETGRQETVETLTPMIQVLPPPVQPKAISIVLKNSDFPGAQELAAALEPKTDKQSIPIEQVQQEQQKAQMVVDALVEQVNHLKDDAAQKDADRQSKERIEKTKIEAQFALEQQKFAHELELAKIEHALKVREVELAHERELEALRHGFAHDRASAIAAAAAHAVGGDNGAGV